MVVLLPQDIIDNIIEAVAADDDSRLNLLKTCALVSSSFLLPSRKRLFSAISLTRRQSCDELHRLILLNPVLQSFVTSITLNFGYDSYSCWNHRSVVDILRLSFCRLEKFIIITPYPSFWDITSSRLKDAISTIVHLSTLKTLGFYRFHVPIALLQGICLTTLILNSAIPDEKPGSPRLADSATTASYAVIDQCKMSFTSPWEKGTRFLLHLFFSRSS